jgi:hypothetical protein
LKSIEELSCGLLPERHAEEPLAGLEHLHRLPQLRVLYITFSSEDHLPPAVVPSFIPPSLKKLALEIKQVLWFEPLLRDVPFMLQTSGASLGYIELELPFCCSAADGAALARILHTCSSTLKNIEITTKPCILDPAFASEVALGLVSCCEGLEFLRVPRRVFESLPPICPIFKRLAHLKLIDYERPVDLTSWVWDRVASGLLPALTAFRLEGLQGLSWGSEGGCRRLVRAFEGVADTLVHLIIGGVYRSRMPVPSAEACHEMGLAIGKLRRLKYLAMALFNGTTSWGGAWRPRGAAHRCSS